MSVLCVNMIKYELLACSSSTAEEAGQWGAALRTLAVVDCGSHSARLLIRRGDRRLARLSEDVHLGEGLDDGNRLQPAAIGRTVDALRKFRQLMAEHGIHHLA